MIVYREASTLAQDLGVPVRTLYAVSNSLPTHYHTVHIPKPAGGERCLTVPDETLKAIQRRIARNLLVYLPLSPHATAYRPGGSAPGNALPHAGRREVLRLDIRHFFDSVSYSAVKAAAFPPEIFAEPLRVLLTILCYYRDALPQGAPTSPAIANLVLRDFDGAVGAWCRGRGIAYTRYCDDLTFSGDRGLDGVHDFVETELRRRGFFLHEGKTARLPAGCRQVVTGLVVNRRVNVPAEDRRALRQEVYYCRRFGVTDHLARTGCEMSPAAYLDHLLGRVGYLLQTDPGSAEAARDRAWLLAERRNWR